VPQLTDEFNGKGVDTKKWPTHNPYWNSREPSRFEPDNVSVAGGRLRLRSDTLLTDLSTLKDPEKNVWVRSAYLASPVPLGHSATNPGKGRLMLMNTHFFRNGWPQDKATPQQWTMPTGAAEDDHVYGVWWKDAETVVFYHNGAQVAQTKTGGTFDEPPVFVL
jgi:hypothetical protein